MRHIAPEIWSDEFFGRLPAEHRLLWIGMLASLADDQGRMLDNPTLMAGTIFPYDPHVRDDIIESGLVLLARHKKIIRYVAGGNGSGRKLIQIANWWKYQRSAHWAARSSYPAPEKWIDRVRTHDGQEVIKANWDHPGGLVMRVPPGMKPQHKTYVGPTLRLRRTNVAPAQAIDEGEGEDEGERDKDKKVPPSNPSQQKADGGRENETNDDPALAQLTRKQKLAAETITRILAASSYGQKRKAILLSAQVATRLVDADPIHYVIASFASAYAAHTDGRARDPVAVAVHQIEHDKVPPAFVADPSTWRSVPMEILKAAGIANLDAYAAQQKIKQFVKGER